MEVLGTYDPIPKEPPRSEGPDIEKRLVKDIRLDTARTKYWLGVGAQPTEPVWKLLSIVRNPFVCESELEISSMETVWSRKMANVTAHRQD